MYTALITAGVGETFAPRGTLLKCESVVMSSIEAVQRPP